MRTSVLSDAVRSLPTASFAMVMATGVVSSAFDELGHEVVSTIMLIIAIVSLAVLGAATVLRAVFFARELWGDTRDPSHAFGLFTIVAAINSVAVVLYPRAQTAAIVLAIVSIPFWVVLTYGLPANLMLRPHTGSIAEKIDGSWFLWVVATQSLAVIAADVAQNHPNHGLAAASVALWGVGVMLYLMLATMVTLKLLTVPVNPAAFNPAYWIYMGATAITVLAGSSILRLPHDLPVISATSEVVSGLTYVMWGFGLWWVPLLIVFEVWRHSFHRVPLRYEYGLWSIVFPLGMFADASMKFSTDIQVAFLDDIGRTATWASAVAWLVVAVGMVRAGVRRFNAVAAK